MKLIILDRDGVINYDSDQFIKSPDEWEPIPGSLEAIAQLNQWGWHVIVISNQSAISRGIFGMDTLNAINEKMVKSLAQVGGRLDAIFFCPHAAEDGCKCRKPLPGMLEEASRRFNVDLKGVPVVGDSLRDLQAGVVMGCVPYLVLTGKGTATQHHPDLPPGTRIFSNLAAAVAELAPLEEPATS